MNATMNAKILETLRAAYIAEREAMAVTYPAQVANLPHYRAQAARGVLAKVTRNVSTKGKPQAFKRGQLVLAWVELGLVRTAWCPGYALCGLADGSLVQVPTVAAGDRVTWHGTTSSVTTVSDHTSGRVVLILSDRRAPFLDELDVAA